MEKPFNRSKWFVRGLMVTVIAFSMMYFVGCSDSIEPTNGSVTNQEVVKLDKANPMVQAVMVVQDRHTADLMSVHGVVGTATGLTEDGRLAIMVYLESEIKTPVKGKGVAVKGIPSEIEGIAVVTEVSGKFVAMDGGAIHRVKQTPPIQLGTSGGWKFEIANGFCCGGTSGSLVQKGGVQYILSNYHVFMGDAVSGDNGRLASAGDPVIQPGLIDVGCNANNAQDVATLEGTRSLPSSNVDAAIAQVISGMVRTDGAILDVGTISSNTVAAALNQLVKKSGRTTGLTRSKVSGLNATVSVTYDDECAGSTLFTKTFTGQILIKNRNRGVSFIAGGDSGSLMAEDVSTNPRAVGLLYAGSQTIAVANPIGQVLSFLGASMVGQ